MFAPLASFLVRDPKKATAKASAGSLVQHFRSQGGFSAACTWVARIRILELRVRGTLSLVAASMNRALIIKVIF